MATNQKQHDYKTQNHMAIEHRLTTYKNNKN